MAYSVVIKVCNHIDFRITEPTEWCAPMVPVVKPNGQVRVCVDFKS